MSSYPKWVYHASEPAQVVESPEAHAALGPEWAEAPVEPGTPAPPPPVSRTRAKKKD